MRALFITPVVPGETGNGLSMRAGLWLESLAQWFDTEVIVFPRYRAHPTSPEFTKTHAKWWKVLSSPRHPDPDFPPVTVHVLPEEREVIRIAAKQADIVVIFRTYLAQVAEIIVESGTPLVLDADDLDWTRERRLGNVDEAERYDRLARMLPRVANVITCASPTDIEELQLVACGVPVQLVANVVRAPKYVELLDEQVPQLDLLMVGTLGYRPNEEGAQWIVNEVLPYLPGVRLGIVGAGAPVKLQRLSGELVTVSSDVSNVSPWYVATRVAVVPVLAGSGTRIKIPEAWAHKRPVVSTTLGAEGIEMESTGSFGGVLLADRPRHFAQECLRLLGDSNFAEDTAVAGYRRYVTDYSIEVGMAQRHAIFDSLLGSVR